MKHLFFIFCCITFFAISGQAQNKKAAKYNDKIINEQIKLEPFLIKFFKDFNSASIESLKEQHNNIVAMLDKSSKKVAAMPVFENDGSLRDAALKWFNLYKESFENEYKEMLPIISKKDKTNEEKTKLNEMHEKLIKEEEVIDTEFASAQKTFADKHKLTLEEANTSK